MSVDKSTNRYFINPEGKGGGGLERDREQVNVCLCICTMFLVFFHLHTLRYLTKYALIGISASLTAFHSRS